MSWYISKDMGGDWKRASLEPLVLLIKQVAGEGKFQPDPVIPLQVEPCEQVFLEVKAAYFHSKAVN